MAVKLKGSVKKANTALKFDDSAQPKLVLTLTIEAEGIEGKVAGELAELQGGGEVRVTIEEIQGKLKGT